MKGQYVSHTKNPFILNTYSLKIEPNQIVWVTEELIKDLSANRNMNVPERLKIQK